MKIFVTTFLILTATSSAFATQWTCKAYCLDQNDQDFVLVVGQANTPLLAFERVVADCNELNYPFTQDAFGVKDLYSTTGEHHEEATVVNSCKMFDPAI